jgi:triosephosphate isomerase
VDNAASYMELENVDGLLVGGASLEADSFIKICHLAANTG